MVKRAHKPKWRSRLFSREDLVRIEKAVEAVESKTTGEIVTLVVPRSAPYFSLELLWFLGGALGGSILLQAFSERWGWGPSIRTMLIWQGALGFLFAGLSHIPTLLRLTFSSGQVNRNVHRECLANFTALGLHATEHHNGVLIYLSELERRVEILADSGIHQKVDKPFWANQVAHLTQGLRKGQEATALCEVIANIGQYLERHFPVNSTEKPKNALPNEVLFGDHTSPDRT